MENEAARLNTADGARSVEALRAPAIVLLLCKQCASISRAVLGRGEMACPCGGQRRVLRIFEDQRQVDLPVATERRARPNY
jgi:hypothetical protein